MASTSFLKVGAKFRDKSKGRNRNENTVTSPTTLKMTNYLETGFDLPPYLDGRYDLTPYMSQSLVENIPNQITPITSSEPRARRRGVRWHRADGGGYAMAEIYAGPKLFILPGLRYEYTSDDFIGRNVRFAPNGTWLGTDPIEHHGELRRRRCPAFHREVCGDAEHQPPVRGDANAGAPELLRHGADRAQDDNALTVASATPTCRPTTSWNVDVLAEHYLKSVGVVSAGVFYKHLTDYIYTLHAAAADQRRAVSGDAAAQRRGGDAVRASRSRCRISCGSCPAPFDGIGVYANYTFTDSTAQFPAASGDSTLPGQSRHVGNLAASYEKPGFSGRASVNFHGSYIDIVGADNTQDRFYDTNRQFDFSATQK